MSGDIIYVAGDFAGVTGIAGDLLISRHPHSTGGQLTTALAYSSGVTTLEDAAAQFAAYMVGWQVMLNPAQPVVRTISAVPSATQLQFAGDGVNLAAAGDFYRVFAPPGVMGDANGANWGHQHCDVRYGCSVSFGWAGYRYFAPVAGFVADHSGGGFAIHSRQGADINLAGNYYCWNRIYSPYLGRWTTPDPAASPFWNLYDYCFGRPLQFADPTGLETDEEAEARTWKELGMEDSVGKYIDFWIKWLGGKQNGKCDDEKDIDDECKKKLKCIVRAISHVESKHGTGTGNHPKEDPMQSGNPNDSQWKALKGKSTGDKPVRKGKLPGRKYEDIVDNLEKDAKDKDVDAEIPDKDDVTKVKDIGKDDGHKSKDYNKKASFFWGVLWFMYKMNQRDNEGDKCKAAWNFGDCSWDRVIQGAVDYNGGGDPEYKSKIEKALKLSGCKK